MRSFYRDFYGCTADLCKMLYSDETRLTVRDPSGRVIKRKYYSSWRGAKIALGRMSDSWKLM